MSNRLTFKERNKLKIELYSGVNMARKREILLLLERDEEQSYIDDIRAEFGDQEF